MMVELRMQNGVKFTGEDGLNRYWRLRMDAFMRHVRIEMQRGVLENDATSEARFAIDIHNNCALQWLQIAV